MSGPRAPKGTYDLLPDEAALRDHVVATAARVFGAHGYRRVVTPEFEETGLFERGVGEATDIVRKEMYTFEDKGGRSMTLRPEGTAPICRLYVEHGLHKWPQPVKLWYYCPMFRYERPQAGRYREHYQLGAEAIGSAAPEVDAEVIAMLAQLFAELGVEGLRLAVNSMGDAACRPAYVGLLRAYLRDREGELCGDCRERLELNPLRTFDCKVETCRAVARRGAAPRRAPLPGLPHALRHGARAAAPRRARAAARLPPRARSGLLHAHDLRVRLRPARRPERRRRRRPLRRARRADRRAADAGRRVRLRPRAHRPGDGRGRGAAAHPAAFVVAFADERRGDAFVLAQELRQRGLAVELDLAARSVKGQLKQAGRSGALFAVLLGLEELPADAVRVRALAGGGEEDVPAAGLAAWLGARIADAPGAAVRRDDA